MKLVWGDFGPDYKKGDKNPNVHCFTLCKEVDLEDNKVKLGNIKDIEARFYGWTLSETQEIDFAWLCKTLKEELKQ